jgi:hypothetical protein
MRPLSQADCGARWPLGAVSGNGARKRRAVPPDCVIPTPDQGPGQAPAGIQSAGMIGRQERNGAAGSPLSRG